MYSRHLRALYSQESGQTEKKPEVATGACFICLYHEKGWEFGMQHTDWIELSITRKECKMPLKLLLLLLSSSFNCWLWHWKRRGRISRPPPGSHISCDSLRKALIISSFSAALRICPFKSTSMHFSCSTST